MSKFARIVIAIAMFVHVQALMAQDKNFPTASGLIDVTQPPYNATGDGTTDDTVAIRNAIKYAINNTAIRNHVLYFPVGTYLVSDTLTWNDYTNTTSATWSAWLSFQGQNRYTTIIKLKDSAPGFNNPANPKAVIFTASLLQIGSSPTLGGKDYTNLGEGNEAFRNSISDLTVDVGAGNSGAIGIDYIASNQGTISDVTIRSSDATKRGVIGLSMTRKWIGPCLVRDVSIDGFNYGIKTDRWSNSITLEDITLMNQKVAGIRNRVQTLAMRGIRSTNTVPVLQNDPAAVGAAFAVLIDGVFDGGSAGVSAIDNQGGGLYLRSITTKGYASVVEGQTGTSIDEYVSHAALNLPFLPASPATTLHLPIRKAPVLHDNAMNSWANVEDFGADGNDVNDDDGPGIQAAIDSGKSTVYFPSGRYFVKNPIRLRNNVRRFLGIQVEIHPAWNNAWGNVNNPQPVFVIDAGTYDTVFFEGIHFTYYQAPYPGAIVIDHTSSRDLVLRKSIMGGSYLYVYQGSASSGNLYIEDVSGYSWRFAPNQSIWAHQFNAEGPADAGLRVHNNGAKLWILGMKVEQPVSLIHTLGGGATELFGGFLYAVDVTGNPSLPAFIVDDSQVSLNYSTTDFSADTNYNNHVQETRAGVTKTLVKSDLYNRLGSNTMLPLFSGHIPPVTPSHEIINESFDAATSDGVVGTSGTAKIELSTEQASDSGYSLKITDATNATSYHPSVKWAFASQTNGTLRVAFDVYKKTTSYPPLSLDLLGGGMRRARIMYGTNYIRAMQSSGSVNIAQSLDDKTWYRVVLDIPLSTTATDYTATITSPDGKTQYGRKTNLSFWTTGGSGPIDQIQFFDDLQDVTEMFIDNVSVHNYLAYDNFDDGTSSGTVSTTGSATVAPSTTQSSSAPYALKLTDTSNTSAGYHPNVKWNFATQIDRELHVSFDLFKQSTGYPNFYMVLNGSGATRARVAYSTTAIRAYDTSGTLQEIATGLADQTWYRVNITIPTDTAAETYSVSVTSLDGTIEYGSRSNSKFWASTPGSIDEIKFFDDGVDTSVLYIDNLAVH